MIISELGLLRIWVGLCTGPSISVRYYPGVDDPSSTYEKGGYFERVVDKTIAAYWLFYVHYLYILLL